MTAVYAVQKDSSIYHLLDREPKETICGLRVSGVELRSKQFSDQILTQSDKRVCKHCIRLTDVKTPSND